MPRYTERLLAGLQLPTKPRSPYGILKNAIKKSKERHEARELERQIESMQLALQSYKRKSEKFLIVAEVAFPKIEDCNGTWRNVRDFTVKPRADGTFFTPKRCRPNRWKGSLTVIDELDDFTVVMALPEFNDSVETVKTVRQPEPDVIEV